MTIRVNGPGGVVINFPDGTSPEVMDKAMREKFGGSPAPQTKPEQTTTQPWGDVAGRAIENLPQSAFTNLIEAPINFAKTAVTDPEQAARAVFSPIAGAVRQIPGLEAAPNDPRGQQSQADFKVLADFYKQRYGTMEGFKEALASDPAGIMTDAAVVASPPLKALGVASKMPALLSVGAKAATNPVGGLLGAAVRQASKIPQAFAGPRSRARGVIADIVAQHPNAQKDLLSLGPEGIVADVLGAEGTRRGRAATNLSPEAADIMDKAVTTRAEGKPGRLLAAEEDTRARHRPLINRAYEVAKAEGYDLPKTTRIVRNPAGDYTMADKVVATNIPQGFQDVINDPMMKPFWNAAEKRVGALERVAPQGDFARLDEFRSLLNKAQYKTTDPTAALAFKGAIEDIDAAMEAANISPGREPARASHVAMKKDVELQKELAARIERRFARTKSGITGNSTTVQQGLDAADIIGRTNIMGDLARGNWGSATAKIVGVLMGSGMDTANAHKLAAQMVEEAKLLTGKQLPTRPLSSSIAKGGSLLGGTTAYGTLLGSKSQQLLGGPR